MINLEIYLTTMAVIITSGLLFVIYRTTIKMIGKFRKTTWNVVSEIRTKKQIKNQLNNDKIRAFHE